MKSLLSPALGLALVAAAPAATILTSYENPGTDGEAFPYEARATFSASDSWNSVTSVGGWSYVDLDPTKNPNRGWGHASSWYLVEITKTSVFQLTLRSSDATARPGFVVYAGESVEDVPGSLHTYSNNGSDLVALNDPWDDNGVGGGPGLDYLGHAHNPSGAEVTGSFGLGPGLYTIAVGNAADSNLNPGGQTFDLTFATVPEPSACLLVALGALGALTLRRRH